MAEEPNILRGTVTPDQYQSQMVDFYNQTLGTGIQTTVPIDEDEKEKKPTVNIQSGMMEGKDPAIQDFSQADFDFSDSIREDYLKNYQLDKEKSIDLSDTSFKEIIDDPTQLTAEFKKFAKQKGKSPTGKLVGGLGVVTGMNVMGLPTPIVAAGMSYLNNKQHFSNLNAEGTMFKIQGQNVSRRPDSLTYTGTLPTGMSQQDVARIDAMRMGKLPGSLRVSDDKDNPEIIGFDGMFDAKTAQDLGGNFDAHGNWHEFKSGYIGKDFRNPQAVRSAFKEAFGGMSIDEYRDNRRLKQSTLNVFTGVFKRNDPTKHNQHIEDFKNSISGEGKKSPDLPFTGDPELGTIGSKSPDLPFTGDPELRTIGPEDQTSDFTAGTVNDSDAAAFDTGGDFGTPPDVDPTSGFAADYKRGGTVGMQAGGMASRVTEDMGFVGGRPPEQVPEEQTVADDVPMEAEDGTFIINAAAVEMAGSSDIEEMLIKAYNKLGGGVDNQGKTTKIPSKEEISILVSRGEVVVPPEIAKIIGYKRLEKINNRGKQEVSRRQSQRKKAREGFAGPQPIQA